jgi:hypothetical protein
MYQHTEYYNSMIAISVNAQPFSWNFICEAKSVVKLRSIKMRNMQNSVNSGAEVTSETD